MKYHQGELKRQELTGSVMALATHLLLPCRVEGLQQ